MTNTHRIRLVVSDVDGTLVTPDKQLTERTRAALEKELEIPVFTGPSRPSPRVLTLRMAPRWNCCTQPLPWSITARS